MAWHLLWVSATPGTGKSVLASWIVNHLQETDAGSGVLYFFIDNKDEDKNTPVSVLRSLVYQAYERSLAGDKDEELDSDLAACIQQSGHERSLDYFTLWTLFQKILDHNPGMTIVIDALDELVSPETLLRSLLKLSCNSKLRLFATSRRDQNIVEELSTADQMIITEPDVTNDIRSFVTWKIQNDSRLSQPQLQNLVINALIQRNQGMFLWVDLMVSWASQTFT